MTIEPIPTADHAELSEAADRVLETGETETLEVNGRRYAVLPDTKMLEAQANDAPLEIPTDLVPPGGEYEGPLGMAPLEREDGRSAWILLLP